MSFCPKCGAQVADGTTFCPNCGYKLSDAQPVSTPSQPQPTTPNHKPCPDNYLVYAILTTLFCCLPFGSGNCKSSSSINQVPGGWLRRSGSGKCRCQEMEPDCSYLRNCMGCTILHHCCSCRSFIVLERQSWHWQHCCWQDCSFTSMPQSARNQATCFPSACFCSWQVFVAPGAVHSGLYIHCLQATFPQHSGTMRSWYLWYRTS